MPGLPEPAQKLSLEPWELSDDCGGAQRVWACRLAKTAPSSMAGSATTLPSHPSTEWEWQIEPHRLQPVLLPNGQRKTLGRGAFGEVSQGSGVEGFRV